MPSCYPICRPTISAWFSWPRRACRSPFGGQGAAQHWVDIDNHAGTAMAVEHSWAGDLPARVRRIQVGEHWDHERAAGSGPGSPPRNLGPAPLLVGEADAQRKIRLLLSGTQRGRRLAGGDRHWQRQAGRDDLRTGRGAGLRIGQDLAVTGFDGSIVADLLQPTLTTVSIPIDEIAGRMVAMALRQVNGGSDGRRAGSGGLPAAGREHRRRCGASSRRQAASLPLTAAGQRRSHSLMEPSIRLRAHSPEPGDAMATVDLEQVTKVYGNGFEAVNDLNLDVRDGEFMVLVGPSGCGKTTALRMVAGPRGDHRRDACSSAATSSTTCTPKDRDIAMVFQNYALYPHMTVSREHRVRAQAAQECRRRRSRRRVKETAEHPRARRTGSTASPASCPAGSGSGSRWAARSCASRRCS